MKRFLAVLHILDKDVEHTHEQVAIAVENGADGIWLINHDGSSVRTHQHFDRVRHRNPDLWMGVNLLDMPAHAAMNIVTTFFSKGQRIDGLWADKSGMTDEGPSHKTRQAWATKRDTGWPGEYFGGVAFKAGPVVQDPARVAVAAKRYMDVVTTSGPATGVPASVDKVREMKAALGDHRLAIASGITPENAPDYLPYADDFLVATGISRDFHTFDPAKVRAVADAIHA